MELQSLRSEYSPTSLQIELHTASRMQGSAIKCVYVCINDNHLMLLYRSKNKGVKSCTQETCGNTEHRLYLVGKWFSEVSKWWCLVLLLLF